MNIKLIANIALLYTIWSSSVMAAEISGKVTNDQGVGLSKVLVCLAYAESDLNCLKTRSTSKKGTYSFKPVRDLGEYVVRVLTSDSISGRKSELYRNYAWVPSSRSATIASRSTEIGGMDFRGTFSFSNFQRSLRLTGTDFPELGGFDVAGDYVFIKIYTVDPQGAGDQDLIFLGQVTDTITFSVEVSVPAATTEILYEIFSTTQSIFGSLSLVAG